MAPVFDQIRDEAVALLRPRGSGRQKRWQGNDARHINQNAPRDGPDDDGSDSEDEGPDKASAKGNGNAKPAPTNGVLGINPLNPIPNVASGIAALIAPSSSSQLTQSTSTTSLATTSTTDSTTSLTTSTTSLTTSKSSSSIATLSTLSTLSTSSTVSSLVLPTPSANNPVAANPQASIPQIVTVSSVTVMTTTAVAAPSTTSSASFINSIFPSSSTVPSSATAALADLEPSPTIFLSDTDSHHDDDSDDNRPPPGGLSPTGEDVLISAGSIGAFILICFVCWIGWRMYKKSRGFGGEMSSSSNSPPNPLLARIPYFGRNQRPWHDQGDGLDMRGPSSMYDQGSVKSMGTKVSVYSMTDARHMPQAHGRQGSMTLPQLNTNVAYTTANPFSASTQSSAYNTHSAQSTQSQAMQNTPSYSQQLPQLQTNLGAASNPFASPEDGLHPDTMSPSSALQYGNGTAQTFDTTATDRSRMPDPYFNQSELARQASTAFDPAKRAVYRASELSSISSGFGDGDFIMPPPAAAQQGAELRPYSFAKNGGLSRSNSVARRSEFGGSTGQRDTVYTTTSEDMPARYRSVNSWVNQQTGRVQRQQERDDAEDIPPVPQLPPEERLTMMMDDGEEPRRYEDTLSSQPPVPTLPSSLNEKSKTDG